MLIVLLNSMCAAFPVPEETTPRAAALGAKNKMCVCKLIAVKVGLCAVALGEEEKKHLESKLLFPLGINKK